MTKNPINFDKDIHGFNVTEKGVRSFSKRLKLGPLAVTVNVRSSGVRASISIPGTGLSKQNITLLNFTK
jgi:hypothetical protein